MTFWHTDLITPIATSGETTFWIIIEFVAVAGAIVYGALTFRERRATTGQPQVIRRARVWRYQWRFIGGCAWALIAAGRLITHAY